MEPKESEANVSHELIYDEDRGEWIVRTTIVPRGFVASVVCEIGFVHESGHEDPE